MLTHYKIMTKVYWCRRVVLLHFRVSLGKLRRFWNTFMSPRHLLPADDAAERIVRHFQANGFIGISEAMVIRLRLKAGDQSEIESVFEDAADHFAAPPVQQFFEIYPLGHFSTSRTFAEARAAIQSDFTTALRMEVPRIFFEAAPVLVDDAMASGTKYDVLMKLQNNVDGYAIAILLNDPDSSFLEYIGTHHGDDWQKIMGNFEITAQSLDAEIIF